MIEPRPIADADVHVWVIALDGPAARPALLLTVLGADERERAGRFVFPRDRDRFVVAHAALRAILGEYLGVPPSAIRLETTARGKPLLAPPHDGTGLRFNLSHSAALALCAVTRGRGVGVDVEAVRPDFAGEDIARRFFSPAEVAALAAVAPGERALAFFRCWTRKEAYIKARGEGLALSLASFDVTLGPDEPPALLATRDDPAEASRWALVELGLPPGYVGALAVEGRGWRLSLADWGGPGRGTDAPGEASDSPSVP
jgi:4'-phosphopantetheinyl transferase